MLSPFELEKKCVDIFQRLGWDVSNSRFDTDAGYDMILRHNDIAGVVVVMSCENLKQKIKVIEKILDNTKIKSFLIFTNGHAFDLYIGNEFFGCLSVPPTPEDIELLLGGANNE